MRSAPLALALLAWALQCTQCIAMATTTRMTASFNVRHLATRARYNWASAIPGTQHIAAVPDPPGYSPAFLYLVSRHGTRWPTRDRMLQMNALEATLKASGAAAEYPWLRDFQAPFGDMLLAGGDLHPVGEQEMHDLGWRLRHRFPGLLARPYLPRRFPIISTQVPRAAASASAFAAGFFPGPAAARPHPDCAQEAAATGALLSCLSTPAARPQPVAITMAPKAADPLLRFFDICPAFLRHEDYTERWLATWMTQTLRHLGPALQHKLQLPRPPSAREVDALWQLCLVEAGLQGNTEGACRLFDEAAVMLLEWVEDVRVWETQGHGAEVNYRMAGPLLADMLAAVKAAAVGRGDGEVARLLFAHAETLVPLAALMGLFRGDLDEQAPRGEVPLDTAEYERGGHIVERDILGPEGVDSLEDVPLAVHPPAAGDRAPFEGPSYFKGREAVAAPIPAGWRPVVPRHEGRAWRGSRVSPYGANMAVVLYRPDSGGTRLEDHLVRLLYNEQVLPLPGCGDLADCPLDRFLEALAPAASPANMSTACTTESSSLAHTATLGAARSSVCDPASAAACGAAAGGGGRAGGAGEARAHAAQQSTGGPGACSCAARIQTADGGQDDARLPGAVVSPAA